MKAIEPMLTIKEIADVLRYSPQHVARLIRVGTLPAFQMEPGAEPRVIRRDFQKFVDARTTRMRPTPVGTAK